MTGPSPHRRPEHKPRKGASPLSLRYVPGGPDEPAYPGDPLMEWRHDPEPPPMPRVGQDPWPPRPDRR